MYEDSPEYRGFFDLLRCFYHEHPVRNPVGGTVESIQGIDPAELTTCYEAFYRTGNAALAVAGPVDPHEILALGEACALAEGNAPESLWPKDLGPVQPGARDCRVDIPRPKVSMGFKDRTLIAGAEDRLCRQLVTDVLLDRLFSAASEIREDLRQRGVADDTLSSAYMSDFSFGFTMVECESDAPEQTIAALRQALLTPVEVDEAYL